MNELTEASLSLFVDWTLHMMAIGVVLWSPILTIYLIKKNVLSTRNAVAGYGLISVIFLVIGIFIESSIDRPVSIWSLVSWIFVFFYLGIFLYLFTIAKPEDLSPPEAPAK